jgi:trehalose 6-phosphate synthase/phosphatase
MKGNERYDRSRKNLEYSARLTTTNWAKHVLSDLKAAEGNSDGSYAVGFGLQYKVMNLKAGFHALDTKEVSKAFRTSRHRLILLDWGGTLVPNVDKQDKFHAYAIATGHASQEGPSEELKHILETLCSDSKNTVFVVSGKEMRAVSKFFGGVKGLGLGAEHGFYYKWPREDASAWDTSSTNASSKLRWQSLTHVADDSWKESAKVVMDIFVQRTHGTYIEQKGNALIWQFSDADPEFGFLQSKELEDHLHSILANYPVEIIRGGGVADGYIEVRPNGASKGLFLEHAYNTLKASNTEPDFVLAIGDDSSDEPMFERISFLSHDQPQMNAFSVTVGKKPSAANAYVDDSSAVLELLTTLTKTMSRDRRYFSVADLPSHALNDLSGFAQQARIDHQDFHHRPPAHVSSLVLPIDMSALISSIFFSDHRC